MYRVTKPVSHGMFKVIRLVYTMFSLFSFLSSDFKAITGTFET